MRRTLLFALAASLAAFLGGFVFFAEHVTRIEPPTEPPKADGVVALTGGGGARIATAMELLQDGKAKRMLVTGVHPAVTEPQLQDIAGGSESLFDCCVDVGRLARSTDGNGVETAEWVETHAITSVIVVTSDFHMPRSLLVLRGSLGDVELTPWPVRSPGSEQRPWWRYPSTTRYLATEYIKLTLFVVRSWLFGAPKI